MNVRCASLAPVVVLLAAAATACARGDDASAGRSESGSATETQACEPSEARALVTQLGAAMRHVSLLAPDTVVARELRDAYAGLVTRELLSAWTDNPESAPGRRVSSPWPRRIQVDSAQFCVVYGTVMYATSADTAADVPHERIKVEVSGDPTRISTYETLGGDATGAGTGEAAGGGTGESENGVAAAMDVLRRYYAAIDAGEFRRAYNLWGEGSAPQSFENFRAGYADTRDVRVTVGSPGRIEGAAGSRYVQVPVEVNASLKSGARQRFTGNYTLRRSVVDGATAAQREWHIYSASLTQAP